MTARRPDMPSQANDPLVLHAWVDESIRVAGPGEGLYVLAAAVTHVRCEAIRGDLRQLLLKGQRRLHWRDEGSSRRRKISERIAGLDIAAVVVVGTPVARKKQGRARRICLERLLHSSASSASSAYGWRSAPSPSTARTTRCLPDDLKSAARRARPAPRGGDAVAPRCCRRCGSGGSGRQQRIPDRHPSGRHRDQHQRALSSAKAGSRRPAGIPASTSRQPQVPSHLHDPGQTRSTSGIPDSATAAGSTPSSCPPSCTDADTDPLRYQLAVARRAHPRRRNDRCACPSPTAASSSPTALVDSTTWRPPAARPSPGC